MRPEAALIASMTEMATYLARCAMRPIRRAQRRPAATPRRLRARRGGLVLTSIRCRVTNPGVVRPRYPDRSDVVWLEHEDNHRSARAVLRVTRYRWPSCWPQVFARCNAVLTSATLTIGGSFDAVYGMGLICEARLAWPGR